MAPTKRSPKTGKRKSYRKQSSRRPQKKSSSKKSPTLFQYTIMVWYASKPSINRKLQTSRSSLKLDDDDEWNYIADVKAHSKAEVKSWLRSLGRVKKYTGTSTERMEVSLI